jgi:hypothetical protein
MNDLNAISVNDSESKLIISILNKLDIKSDSEENKKANMSINQNEQKNVDSIFAKNLSPEVTAEIDLNTVHHVTFKELHDTDLPTNSLVYVSYINHPLDFVV